MLVRAARRVEIKGNARQEHRQADLWLCHCHVLETHTHMCTHTHSQTCKDGSQAGSVMLYGSPVRNEHMEESSCFQLLEWTRPPAAFLSGMRGSIQGPGRFIHWTHKKKKFGFTTAEFEPSLSVHAANISLRAVTLSRPKKNNKKKKRLCEQLGNQTVNPPPTHQRPHL